MIVCQLLLTRKYHIGGLLQGQDWNQLKAVKNKQVYKVPLGIYRWYPPNGDAPLVLKWMAQHNHP